MRSMLVPGNLQGAGHRSTGGDPWCTKLAKKLGKSEAELNATKNLTDLSLAGIGCAAIMKLDHVGNVGKQEKTTGTLVEDVMEDDCHEKCHVLFQLHR